MNQETEMIVNSEKSIVIQETEITKQETEELQKEIENANKEIDKIQKEEVEAEKNVNQYLNSIIARKSQQRSQNSQKFQNKVQKLELQLHPFLQKKMEETRAMPIPTPLITKSDNSDNSSRIKVTPLKEPRVIAEQREGKSIFVILFSFSPFSCSFFWFFFSGD